MMFLMAFRRKPLQIGTITSIAELTNVSSAICKHAVFRQIDMKAASLIDSRKVVCAFALAKEGRRNTLEGKK